jgi:hypothetical protein
MSGTCGWKIGKACVMSGKAVSLSLSKAVLGLAGGLLYLSPGFDKLSLTTRCLKL